MQPMDPFQKEDINRTQKMDPKARMQAVFATVNAGIRIQLAKLRSRRPLATDAEIQAELVEWLATDGIANR
jgi:hypothetical protein